jgi:hypothetical protein
MSFKLNFERLDARDNPSGTDGLPPVDPIEPPVTDPPPAVVTPNPGTTDPTPTSPPG